MPGGFLAGSIHFWMHPQIPPDVAVLHRLRFWVRGNAVQMRGKQAFGVWQYTFITGQRKSAEPAKTRLCAGVICCLVLGAGLDVQNLADGFIIAVMLFQLRLDGFKLLLVHRNQSFHNTHRFGMLNENAFQPFQEIFNGSVPYAQRFARLLEPCTTSYPAAFHPAHVLTCSVTPALCRASAMRLSLTGWAFADAHARCKHSANAATPLWYNAHARHIILCKSYFIFKTSACLRGCAML